MAALRLALLALAALPLSAAAGQGRAVPVPPPVVAPPPIVVPRPGPPPIREYPRFDDDLIRIYFDYDSAALSPTAERIVDLAAERARRCYYLAIRITGHVDAGTRPSRAMALSRKMAKTVRRGLIARGLDPARIEAVGYGATRPAIATAPGAREPFNRRIEMDIDCPGGS